MEMILFCGIQATGKSSFYKAYFFDTHLHISMDLLNTRNKELKLIQTCLEVQQRFVVDNTNPTKTDRAYYIQMAKARKFKVIGYYFQSKIADALERNQTRHNEQRVPDKGLLGTFKKLELPTMDEGFDELHYVTLKNGTFQINKWQDEI